MNERTRFTSWASVFESSWLVIGLKWTSDQNVPMFLLRLHEISRGREKIVPFSDSTSLRDWYNLSVFFQLIYSCFLVIIFPPIASLQFRHINPHTTNNSSNRSDEGLTLETSAFSFFTVATSCYLEWGPKMKAIVRQASLGIPSAAISPNYFTLSYFLSGNFMVITWMDPLLPELVLQDRPEFQI